MRPFILISAALVFASPAIAHNWQEYSYPDYSFTVTFPADPQIETTTYQVTDDRKAEAHIQSACSGPRRRGHDGVPGAAVADDGRRFEIECRRQHAQVALWQAVNSGDLNGAQRAYSSLSQLPSSADPNGPLAQAISQVGQALKRGDLTAAQNALSSLR